MHKHVITFQKKNVSYFKPGLSIYLKTHLFFLVVTPDENSCKETLGKYLVLRHFHYKHRFWFICPKIGLLFFHKMCMSLVSSTNKSLSCTWVHDKLLLLTSTPHWKGPFSRFSYFIHFSLLHGDLPGPGATASSLRGLPQTAASVHVASSNIIHRNWGCGHS